MKSLHLRAGCAAALAAGVLLAGCSSEPDYPDAPAGPQNTASAEGAASTEAAAPPAGEGEFPDVNAVPTERPSSTIQDLNQAPEGLSGAESGTQYGEELVGGPTSSADRPAPPPEPELPPIPEAGITETSEDSTGAEEAVAEPVAEAPAVEAAPEPEAAAPASQPAPQSAPPQSAPPQSAPLAPMPGAAQAQAVTPVGTPQPGAKPFQPDSQLALTPGSMQAQGAQNAYMQPQAAYGPNYAALAPENYGVQFSQPALPPYQAYSAQAMYRSPYASPPTNYGGAIVPGQVVPGQVAAPMPGLPTYAQTYGQPYGAAPYGAVAGGQPVGLVYFRDGSARLSSDDRKVLKQIAEMHRMYGGVIRVVGHASMRTGSMDLARHQQANQRISEARAQAVARQLARYGVPEAAIQTIAAGDTQPVYAEVMPTGEAANRRAEVYLSAY